MKKAKKLLISFLTFALLAVNIIAAHAQVAATSNKVLPPSVEGYFDYLVSQSNLTSSQIDQLRSSWIAQIELNKQMLPNAPNTTIPSAVPINSSEMSSMSYSQPCLLEFGTIETWGLGTVSNAQNAYGDPDDIVATLETPASNQYCGAGIAGEMTGTDTHGWITIRAALTPAGQEHSGGHNNEVFVLASNDINLPREQWQYIGHAYVGSGYLLNINIGYANTNYKIFDIGCMIDNANGVTFNSIYVDSLTAQYGSLPAYLTLNVNDGGSASAHDSLGNYLGISGAWPVTRGDNAQVYAQPYAGHAFDHWNKDGINVGNANPYSVYMDADHTLQPVFISNPLTVIAQDQLGWYGFTPVYPNVYVDGNYVGTAPLTIQVSAGYHTVAVDEWTWDEAFGGFWTHFWYMYGGGGQYSNGQSIYISGGLTLYAAYNPQA
ncbi:MAG: PEGA domain-containing protein [Candidatus Bathyarchaeota archaeon]|nr:PEGA domain-containing protein [Candidatus Bathyarchaeota archaeon]